MRTVSGLFFVLFTGCASDADVANAAHAMCTDYCRVVGGTLVEVHFEINSLGLVDTECACALNDIFVDVE